MIRPPLQLVNLILTFGAGLGCSGAQVVAGAATPSPRCLTFIVLVTCGLLSTSGCLVAPTPMPTSFPRASERGHLKLGIGFQMTLNSKLESTGKGEEDLGGALGPPDLRVLGLQMLFASYRRRFGEAWDWGVDGALSRVGGSVRWGGGSDRYAISVQAGLHWLPLKSVQGHGEVQLGFRSKHFMAFFTAGLVGSHLTYAMDRSEEQHSPTDFFLYAGPDKPWLEIRQLELAARAGLLFGFRTKTDAPWIYIGFLIEAPFVTSSPSFTCHGCPTEEGYFDFHPGFRPGATIGLSM